jgi:hypothetical protein
MSKELNQKTIELENLIGNLMIAEYQVEKLRGRVTEKFGRYGFGTDKKSIFTYVQT